MKDLIYRSACEHAASMARKEYSARELTRAYLSHIEETDEQLGCFLHVCPERALARAEEIDRRRMAGETLPALAGIPVALKDNICTKAMPTTCASRMLAHYQPPYNATVADRLEANGAILVGKLNMDELGMGSTTEHSAFRITRNPHDPTRVPGGSSGGCAAAVASHQVPLTLGSDTGGSVRLPSAFCGTVGLRPTYGAVSRYGLVAFASSLDQIGPITATVADASLLFSAIRGADPHDATTCPSRADAAPLDPAALRVGIPRELTEGLQPDVARALRAAADALSAAGATLIPMSLPSAEASLYAYYILSAAEVSSNLARLDGVRYGHRAARYASMEELYCRSRSEGFGTEVKRRILLGTFALSEGYYDAYYGKAQQVRAQLRRELSLAFESCDLLLGPTAPSVAYPLGQKRDDPVARYREDLYCVPASMAGVPALSVPFGYGEQGLPIGMQLIGAAHSEPLLLQAGAHLERYAKEVYQA